MGQTWVIKLHIMFWFLSPSLLFSEVFNVFGDKGELYAGILERRSALPLDSPYGSNWDHKIKDLMFSIFYIL